ncbi:GatB/YqeY domain-containing protein [Deferrisoma camini]|uniref:GatB/YqeY domain-containing protein n=1 Tax=Deferrisoma camini TaxID=1035120 RepID=UPI0004A252B2|nr:GatB/YqeY domain-containing protein [Deferrisoma camini]
MAEVSTLEQRIDRALTAAMKARDAARVAALRNIRAELERRRIEKRAPLGEDEVLAALGTLAKQRRESIAQFRAGGREDLVAKEEADLAVIEEFLPAPLSEEELRAEAARAVEEVGATGPRDMGRVMKVLMTRVRGRADGGRVSALVRELLAGERN